MVYTVDMVYTISITYLLKVSKQGVSYLVTPVGYDRTWSNKSIAKGTTDPGVGFFCLSERLNLINNSKGAALHIQQSGAQGTLLGEEDTKMEALVAIKW